SIIPFSAVSYLSSCSFFTDPLTSYIYTLSLHDALPIFTSIVKYPLRGSYTGDPQRGWAGPYITSMPKTDPWGDKYLINVRNLHSGYLRTFDGGSSSALPKLAVIVISAGPNRNIETRVDQSFDNFASAGQDMVFRIK